MPVTAPTSSAMVTTRMARLMLTFQLVKILGTIAGSISLRKNCSVVGRNDRIIWRSSRGTPRMASRVSIRNTGPQTTTSTKPIRNSTPGNHSTANRIQDTTGTAIRRRIIGCRYFSRDCERYIAIASARPSPNETRSAPITRASVTTMSAAVMSPKLFAILTKLGMANAGIPSVGARCDSTSQQTTTTSSETRVWRGNFRSVTATRCSSWDIDDLLVRHVLVEPGLHCALHHVGDRLAGGRVPGRLHDHVQPLGGHRRGENSGRQLQRLVGDLVGCLRLVVKHLRGILQRRQHHLRSIGNALDRFRPYRGDELPAVDAGHLPPAFGAIEDDAPIRILPGDDAGQRLDHQRRVDAAGLELRPRDREIGIDHGDVLAEVETLGVRIDPHDLE